MRIDTVCFLLVGSLSADVDKIMIPQYYDGKTLICFIGVGYAKSTISNRVSNEVLSFDKSYKPVEAVISRHFKTLKTTLVLVCQSGLCNLYICFDNLHFVLVFF